MDAKRKLFSDSPHCGGVDSNFSLQQDCTLSAGPQATKSEVTNLYPKQSVPFGSGIFEEMHWQQTAKDYDINIQNPYLAGAIFHLPWALLQPYPEGMDTDLLDRILSTWTSAGKK